jgi:cell division protein FtsB
MASDVEGEVDPTQPHDRRPAQVTTIRKAILIGALVALLVGGASSLATARLTDRQSDLDEQRAEITQLVTQVSQQEAQIARQASQAGEGPELVDRLNAQIAALEEQVQALEAEKTRLEQQLSQILNPATGPAPTALLTAIWVQRPFPYVRDYFVCVEIENTSDSDLSISYGSSQFSAVDGDNFAYPSRQVTPGYGPQYTLLMGGQLTPGLKSRGMVWFDVPEQAVLTRLVWNAGFGETPEIAVDLLSVTGVSWADHQC